MAVTNLIFVQQQMIRYGMSIYFALGIIGNVVNCIIFTRPLYRRAPSSIYFLFLSFFAIIYLIWSITPQIYTLNHDDPQPQSIIYCKLRLYGSVTLGQCLRYFIVLACIDRFVITRTNVRIRSLHSVQMAIKLVFITVLFCFASCLHIPILMDIRLGVCGMFGLYKVSYTFFQIIFVGILPPILMCIFSITTIRTLHQRHINHIHARKRDRDFMRMVIGEVMINIITSIPYSSNLVYGALTNNVVGKSAERIEIEAFIFFCTQFLIYSMSVAPFYLFILTSKPFRKDFINLFIKNWKKPIPRRNQIIPLTEHYAPTTMKDRMIYNKK